MCLNFEQAKRDGLVERESDNFKHHIMLIVSEQIAKVSPNINDSKKIDSYCAKLLQVVPDINIYAAYISNGYKTLQSVIKEWIKRRGSKYRHGIKDNPSFTQFLLTYIRGGNLDKIEYDIPQSLVLRGRVVKSRRDRNGFNYGFIQHSPYDVFFHEKDNQNLDFTNIYGKTVLYHIFPDPLNGEDRAEILEVISDDSYSI